MEEALRAPLCLLYKHSGSCPISAVARREIDRLERAVPSLPVFMLDVNRQRALSRSVAHALDVRHESPQVILIRDGTVIWHAAHFAVTAAAIMDNGGLRSE